MNHPQDDIMTTAEVVLTAVGHGDDAGCPKCGTAGVCNVVRLGRSVMALTERLELALNRVGEVGASR